jgi:hypothetical protein
MMNQDFAEPFSDSPEQIPSLSIVVGLMLVNVRIDIPPFMSNRHSGFSESNIL